MKASAALLLVALPSIVPPAPATYAVRPDVAQREAKHHDSTQPNVACCRDAARRVATRRAAMS